jgi:hypothetical protein
MKCKIICYEFHLQIFLLANLRKLTQNEFINRKLRPFWLIKCLQMFLSCTEVIRLKS